MNKTADGLHHISSAGQQPIGPSNLSFPLAPGERVPAGTNHMAPAPPIPAPVPPPAVLTGMGGAPAPPVLVAPASTVTLDYPKDFPSLPETGNTKPNNPLAQGQWRKPLPKVKSSHITQVFHLPAEERRIKDFEGNHQFGEKNHQEQMQCNEIASQTGTTIELCESRDHCLTIVVTGKRGNVEEARKLIVAGLQTQASREIRIPREHHRVLIGREGRKLQELQAESDCRIIIPGKESNSDVVRIIGPREGIEKAVHQVQLISDEQSKLAQEHLIIPRIYYPWIRGPFNETLAQIESDLPNVRVNIPPPSASSEVIVVTGEKDGVYKAAAFIRSIFEEKQQTVKAVTCKVAPAQHRYIIGAQRSGLAEILKETGVSVEMPPEESGSDTVTLRGDPDKLGQALTMVYAKASSVITAEIECPQWLHRFIIGQGGSNIRQIIGDQPKVSVNFEDSGHIYLEGGPEEVRRAHEAFSNLSVKLQEEMSHEVIRVSPTYHRHIIGKAGGHISKIKQETGVLINIPDESMMSDEIRIEGKREGVRQAKDEILQIVKRLMIENFQVSVPIFKDFHKNIIGKGGHTIRKIRDTTNTKIDLPAEQSSEDTITITGRRENVEKAVAELTQLQNELVREGHPNVRILFPRQNDNDQESIHLIGRKEDVASVKKQLEDLINELNTVNEIKVDVPVKWHRHFVYRGAAVLKEIQIEFGDIMISFPKQNSNNTTVIIKGGNDLVEGARKRILEIVNELEAQVTISVPVLKEHHSKLLSNRGAKIQDISAKHNVQIKFPDRENNPPRMQGGQQQPVMNGSAGDSPPKSRDVVLITGLQENCDAAKQDLLAQVPIQEVIEVPFEFHGTLIGSRGKGIRDLQNEFDVTVTIPEQRLQCSQITVTGPQHQVNEAVGEIQRKLEEFERQARDRRYLPDIFQIVSRNLRMTPSKIRAKYDVQIEMPSREKDRRQGGRFQQQRTQDEDEIIIRGYEESARHCKDELEQMVSDWQGQFGMDITLDCRIHNRLIGQKGKTIRKIMDEFKVDIKLPRSEDPDPNLVRISGKDEESVLDCVDHLRNLEEEYLQEMTDTYVYPRREEAPSMHATTEVTFTNAPWSQAQAPDTSNIEEFPAMGAPMNGAQANGPAPPPVVAPAWGRRR